MNDELLILIAGYIRKTNHPEETDQQIAANVRNDLAKVIRANAAQQIDAGTVPPEYADAFMAAANARAASFEVVP